MATAFQLWLLGASGKTLLMDTRTPAGPRVADPVAVEALNCAPSLTFTIDPSHPAYGALVLRASWLELTEVGAEERPIRFRLIAPSRKSATATYTAEGTMAALNDSVQPHGEFTGTPADYLAQLLAVHNTQMRRADGSPDPYRVIQPGVVSDDLDPNNLIVRRVDADLYPLPTTMDILKRSTWESTAGGFVRLRTTADGINYLDWLSSGELLTQVIRYGGTLRQWSHDMSAAKIITACEPFGKQLDDDEGNQTSERLALGPGDSADLLYVDPATSQPHYGMINRAAADMYGLVVASATWDDVTTATMLRQRAADQAATQSLTAITVTAQALDEHLRDTTVAELSVGDRVVFVVPDPVGITQTMQIVGRRRSLVSAVRWEVDLGAVRSSLVATVSDYRRTADQVTAITSSTAAIGQKVSSVASAVSDTQSQVAQVVGVAEAAREDARQAALDAAAAAQASAQASADASAATRTAEAAQGTAEAAQEAAAAAAGIADGKATVLFQDTPPDDVYQMDSTLWIDTTDGLNTPMRWDGTGWVAVTDQVAVDAAATAAAATTAATQAQQTAATAQQTAATAQSTATDAKMAATAAQATADQATKDAAAAQTTANDAQTTATSAQDLAGFASAAAAAAQATASNAWVALSTPDTGVLDTIGGLATQIATSTATLQSAITQLPDTIRSEVSATYVTQTAMAASAEALTSQLAQTATGLYLSLSQVQALSTELQGTVSGLVSTVTTQQTLIWADIQGIHIGRSNDPVQMLLSNGALNFYLNGNRVAYFDGAAQRLHIQDAEILGSLRFGSEKWIPEQAGGMSWIAA